MVLGVPKRTLIVAGALIGLLVLYGLGGGNQRAQERQQGSGTESAVAAAPCRVTVTADSLNLRSEPRSDAAKVGQVSKGRQLDADKVVQNGFRKVAVPDNNGRTTWASNDYLVPVAGHDCG
jgi:uncharacterized protein YgiM (DUF1202 family)